MPSESPAPTVGLEGRKLERRSTVLSATVAVIVSMVALGILYVANPSWAVTPGGWLDPWVYVNYFLDYPGRGDWDLYYKASRVPWNVVGSAAVGALGLDGGQLVLAGLSTLLLGVSAFLTLRFISIAAGCVATVFFMVMPIFHGSGGWLYQNSLAGPLLMSLAAISVTAIAKPGRFLEPPDERRTALLQGALWLAAGAVTCLILIVNTMVVIAAVPLLGALVVAHATRGRYRLLMKRLAIAVGGAALVVVACALASRLMGGRYVFYQPLVNQFQAFSETRDDTVWWEPLSTGWWEGATYLALPLVSVAFSIWFLLRFRLSLRTTLNMKSNTKRGATTLSSPPFRVAGLLAYWTLGATGLFLVSYAAKMHLLNFGYHAYPTAIAGCAALTGIVFAYGQVADANRWMARSYLDIGAAGIAAAGIVGLLIVRPGELVGLLPVLRISVPVIVAAAVVFVGAVVALLTMRISGPIPVAIGALPVGLAIVLSWQTIGPGYSPLGAYAAGGCKAGTLENKAIINTVNAFGNDGSFIELQTPGPRDISVSDEGATQCVVSVGNVAASLSQIYPFVVKTPGSFNPDLSASNPNPILRLEIASRANQRVAKIGGRTEVKRSVLVELPKGRAIYGVLLRPQVARAGK